MTTLAQLMRSHYVSLNCYLNDAVRTRGDFVRDFLAALVDWNYGDEFAGDTPLFRGETVSDSYLSELFVVRDGLGAAIPFKSAEVAVQSYCMMADNPASHPFLLLSVGESMAELVLNRRTDGQHHLLLPQTVPAEMLRSREFYGAVVTICRAMAVVVHNAGKNAFFMKKLAEAQTDFDSFEPFRDDKSTLCFEVCEVFGARKEIFDGFEEAAAAWKKNPFRLSLTLRYENATEALSARKRLAFLGQWHFENIYQDAVLMCDRKIRDLLAEHSSGRRTFFGIE